jgi:hypothetical protein
VSSKAAMMMQSRQVQKPEKNYLNAFGEVSAFASSSKRTIDSSPPIAALNIAFQPVTAHHWSHQRQRKRGPSFGVFSTLLEFEIMILSKSELKPETG